MGIMLSMALMPVCRGTDTLLRLMMPGAGRSMGRISLDSMAPRPSTGWPRELTTRPISPSPTGTETTWPVRETLSPSLIPSSDPSITMATEFSSRFSAMPYAPLEKRTSSFAMHLSSPLTRAMPSPIMMMVPVSLSEILFS